jgi:hypothetical protein
MFAVLEEGVLTLAVDDDGAGPLALNRQGGSLA